MKLLPKFYMFVEASLQDLISGESSKPRKPRIRRTYSTTTEESAEDGDFAEIGWLDINDRKYPDPFQPTDWTDFEISMIPDDETAEDLGDVDRSQEVIDGTVDYLNGQGVIEASSSPTRMPGEDIWYSSYDDEGYGEHIEINYHLEGFTEDELQEIYDRIKQ